MSIEQQHNSNKIGMRDCLKSSRPN